jgi:hypothetical protein
VKHHLVDLGLAAADRDINGTGRRHAEKVRAQLQAAGIRCRIVESRVGKDIRDHLDAGYTLIELVQVDNPAEPPEPEQEESPDEVADQSGSPEDQKEVDRRYLDLLGRLLDVAGLGTIPPPIPLVDGWLYCDSLAWLSGKPGHAKTFVAVELACCVGTGTPWHGMATRSPKARCST